MTPTFLSGFEVVSQQRPSPWGSIGPLHSKSGYIGPQSQGRGWWGRAGLRSSPHTRLRRSPGSNSHRLHTEPIFHLLFQGPHRQPSLVNLLLHLLAKTCEIFDFYIRVLFKTIVKCKRYDGMNLTEIKIFIKLYLILRNMWTTWWIAHPLPSVGDLYIHIRNVKYNNKSSTYAHPALWSRKWRGTSVWVRFVSAAAPRTLRGCSLWCLWMLCYEELKGGPGVSALVWQSTEDRRPLD